MASRYFVPKLQNKTKACSGSSLGSPRPATNDLSPVTARIFADPSIASRRFSGQIGRRIDRVLRMWEVPLLRDRTGKPRLLGRLAVDGGFAPRPRISISGVISREAVWALFARHLAS
jgi:hypothetical protein